MSNVSQFVSKEQIQSQACEWISKLDRGLKSDEEAMLQDWVNESPANYKSLVDMASLWDDLSVLNELKGLIANSGVKKRKTKQWFMPVSAAASFLVLVLVGWVTYSHITPSSSTYSEAPITQFASTKVGEQKNLVLSDGSEILLNTQTSVKIDYYSDKRVVHLLQGEAHFDVASNKSRPFTVYAGEHSVTAVGTAFNMEFLDSRQLELVVTEGKVLVKNSPKQGDAGQVVTADSVIQNQGVLVFSGERAWVSDRIERRESLTQSEMSQNLAWQEGQLVFSGDNLESVLKEISRYSSQDFIIDNDALKQTQVAGYFKVGDINSLLASLEYSFGIAHHKDAHNVIHLSSIKDAP